MFVSPPPASLATHVLQRKYLKKNHNANSSNSSDNNHNNDNNCSRTVSIDDNNSIYTEQSITNPIPIENSRKDADFISAPPEYSNRARDEIRKRLLPGNTNNNNNTGNHSNSNINNTHSHNSISKTTSTIEDASIFSDNASSYQSSIFSHPSTNQTINTHVSDSSYELQHHKFITEISLEDALPKTFYDMYTPDVLLSDPSKVLYNGRPSFTKRELLDWDLNDIRSLLIVEKSRPEWGNQLPLVISSGPNLPKFRFQLLPLNSMDNEIIHTLVTSDLYMEANLDYEFKLTSAKYTVAAARKRHEQMVGHHEIIMNLSKPEWRNIIENYLLNIAVEAQCRFDFKQRCSEYRKWKMNHLSNLKKPDMPPPRMIPQGASASTNHNHNNLLKMTLMKNFNNNATTDSNQQQKQSLPFGNSQANKISLNQEEKSNLWSQCQAQVYQRLGLDWKPDGIR